MASTIVCYCESYLVFVFWKDGCPFFCFLPTLLYFFFLNTGNECNPEKKKPSRQIKRSCLLDVESDFYKYKKRNKSTSLPHTRVARGYFEIFEYFRTYSHPGSSILAASFRNFSFSLGRTKKLLDRSSKYIFLCFSFAH